MDESTDDTGTKQVAAIPLASPETKKKTIVIFLCGCTNAIGDLQENLIVDEEGFVLCPNHDARRYGWKSRIRIPHKAFPFDEKNPEFVMRPAFGISEQENELIFWLRLGLNIVQHSTPSVASRGSEGSGG